MDVTRKDLEQRYAEVNDQALLDGYASGTLTEMAASVVRDELRRRGIPLPTAPTEQTAPVPHAPAGTGPLVSVAKQLTWVEANILCSLLNSEGIAAELGDAYLATAHQFLSSTTGGISLLVHESNLLRARDVIAAMKRGEFALDDEGREQSSKA